LRRRDGNIITLVGAPAKPLGVSAFGLIMGRRSLTGSAIGGIAETQEMLDFCGAHNITADVEVIPILKVNEACIAWIDAILEGDSQVHKKQRHTAYRIFERLRDEQGFTGACANWSASIASAAT
jgi:hypothetical protein